MPLATPSLMNHHGVKPACGPLAIRSPKLPTWVIWTGFLGAWLSCSGTEVQAQQIAAERPQYNPPVHIAPVRGNQLRREALPNGPRDTVATTRSRNTARGSNEQVRIDEPFTGTVDRRSDQGAPAARVSQTPAPLSTRPQRPEPQRRMPMGSVLNSDTIPLPGVSNPPTNSSTSDPNLFLEPEFESGELMSPQTRGVSGPTQPRNWRAPQDDNAFENSSGSQAPERDSETEIRGKFSNKSCDDYRRDLLNRPLVDIALDISPPPDENQAELPDLVRDWTDMRGNVIARGRLVDLRRGYVILDNNGSLSKVSMARLGEADLAAIAGVWQVPTECLVDTSEFFGRCWEPQTVTWHASSLCHKPLYFENVQLERYGHSAGPVLGPIRATGHFFGSVLLFPYHTAINPPNECVYPLGHYRPGNCAPWLVDPFPISLRGAVRQGAVVTGGFFLF